MPKHAAPVHLVGSYWRLTRQTNLPTWPGRIEVARMEFDEDTGVGIVHLRAEGAAGWELRRVSLNSFQTLIDKAAITPA